MNGGKMKPNFSVVLIVKNEEKTLPKMLDSLKEFRDRGGEIVICDTGSKDNTAKVAREYGCVVDEVGEKFIKVITKEMANKINRKFSVNEGDIVKFGDKLFDFASARNHAASLASNDLISNQDADEAYTKLDIDRVCQLINEGHDQFEYNFVFSHDQFGNEAIKFVQSKFYNRRKMQWEGIVHEVLQPIVQVEIKRLFLDESIIKLEHWQNSTTSRGAYLKGLAVDCFQNPNKDRQSHYFARELLWCGKPKSAIKEFEHHIAMNKWVSERAQSMIFIADAYGQLNQGDKQIEWYHKAFVLDSSRRESLIRLAHFFRARNEPQKVACYIAAAMEIPWVPFYANYRNHYTNEPHELMYWAKGWLGDIEGAKHHILKALEYQPYNRTYLEHTKYYFEYPDNLIEGWMRFPELLWLYETSKKMNTIAEIGSWKGKSTHALCSGCKNGVVTAIDHFLGSKGEEEQHKEAQEEGDKVYNQFLENMKAFTNLKINRKDSLEAAKEYPDKSFDMVFIDAEHTYEGEKKDIRAWRNKARIVLCGHDYSDVWPEVKRAINEEMGEVNVCDSIWFKYVGSENKEREHPIVGPSYDLRLKLKDYENLRVLNCGIGPGDSGLASQLPFFKFKHLTHIDIYQTYLYKAKEIIWDAQHVEFINKDVRDISSFDEYDLCLMFDFIEHLPKDDAMKVLSKLQQSSCKVLMFVPIEKEFRINTSGVESEEHKSFWTEDEFKNLGFQTELLKGFHGYCDALWVMKEETELKIEDFQKMIEKDESFIFTKKGDGEKACMEGQIGENCDHHKYSKELGEKLKEAFEFLKDKHYVVDFDDQKNFNVLLHRKPNDLKKLKEFYITIRNSSRKKVFVGPERLRGVCQLLNAEFVEVLLIDAFDKYNEILEELKSKLEDDAIFIFSAGMVSKVLITDLLKINSNIICLDTGSAFDPIFVGQTRTEQYDIDTLKELYKDLLTTLPKVSIVIPTLGREEKLQRLLKKIIENANYFNYEVIVEQDSFENRQGVPKTLKRGVEKSTGELVMYLGNDCIPEKDFLKNAVDKMIESFPDLDGLVGLNDGYFKIGEIATHWLASKKLLPYLEGEFFCTQYKHLGCDNELTERCRKINKYVWCKNAKTVHEHPISTGKWDNMDEVHKIAWDPKCVEEDRELFRKRAKELGFEARENFVRPTQEEIDNA